MTIGYALSWLIFEILMWACEEAVQPSRRSEPRDDDFIP
jgi:hypothetical protein